MVTSKCVGLSPIFLSIIVASRKELKRKNSSTFPVAVCENKRMDKYNNLHMNKDLYKGGINVKKKKKFKAL